QTNVSQSHDGRRIRVEKDGLGIVAEVYSDSIVHFELTAGPQDVEKPIYTTPMVSNSTLKPAQIIATPNGFSTQRLAVTIDPNSLCVSVHDKAIGRPLVKNCPINVRESWKGITLDVNGFDDVYGLGSYFRTWGSADGTWKGAVWDPLPDTQGNAMRRYGE